MPMRIRFFILLNELMIVSSRKGWCLLGVFESSILPAPLDHSPERSLVHWCWKHFIFPLSKRRQLRGIPSVLIPLPSGPSSSAGGNLHRSEIRSISKNEILIALYSLPHGGGWCHSYPFRAIGRSVWLILAEISSSVTRTGLLHREIVKTSTENISFTYPRTLEGIPHWLCVQCTLKHPEYLFT